MTRRAISRVLVMLLAASVLAIVQAPAPAQAAVANEFNPGNIISDAAFYDGSAMTASQVQAFLNQQVPRCQDGWTCLKDYRQATPNMAADYLCAAYTGGANESAAEILAKVGAACNISQRVLLVLLQKEMSLVTHTWPSQWRFDKATGFACPDTAPCNPAYGGFFYQVYYAARQFQRYAAEPHRYNYQAGRVNHILFHPNAACGTSPVFIANKATAALYNYTPYQPNGAALTNLYGTGDSCSSYGNRNFWRLYSDWFGSPAAGSSLVRTAGNSTVYLIAGDKKYPIPSLGAMNALSPLGQVAYVSDAFLSGYSTGVTAGGVYRNEDGAMFILDNGFKVSFASCNQLADFGYSCDADTYVQLTNFQASAFTQGPVMTNLVGTHSGARFFVDDGGKAEILDQTSQTAAGISGAMTVLTDSALNHLPFAAPIARDDVLVATRGSANTAIFIAGDRLSLSAQVSTHIGAASRAVGTLDTRSVALRGNDLGAMSTMVKDDSGVVSILSSAGKWTVTLDGLDLTAHATSAPQWFIDSYTTVGTVDEGSFLIGPRGGTVYIAMPDSLRPISSWGALEALAPDGVISIKTVDDSVLSALPQGPVALTAGKLVRSPEHATVYYINGVTSRIAFSSFIFPQEAGFTGMIFSSSDRINAYPLDSSLMAFGYLCGTDKYIAGGGSLHYIAPELEALYPGTYVALDQFSCAAATIGAPATRFVRGSNGTIWMLSDEGRAYVTSMARLQVLGGSEGWINLHDLYINSLTDLGAA